MKIIFLLFSFSLSFLFVSAQAGEWVWIHGSNTTGSLGNFGTQGMPSLTNEPPALYEPAEWTDLNGKFWFYGGLDNNGGNNVHNDLWMYDPVSDEWTWIAGTHTYNDLGNYGAQGVASASNRPPGLAYGATTWTDINGDLWIFGGWNANNLSDLWRYNISSNEWTWMKGPGIGGQPGIYGTQGVPDTANYPPSRSECSASWTSNAGDLWFFGGLGTWNDLWRYTIATNTWTWMKGSSARNALGVWGIEGLEDPANTPSSRFAYTRWKDKSGNLWLFGGQGYDLNGIGGQLGDLWRYNILTNNWTWVSGSNLYNGVPFYGTKCSTTPSNVPANRGEARASWTDNNGNFWMFGGFDQSSFTQSVSLNDLWMYCVASNEWTWESGDSTTNAGSWGTLNVASPANKPDGRVGSIGWTDHNGHLYLFAGSSTGYRNDLWKYTIDPACGTCVSVAPPVTSFQASDSVFCSGNCIDFTDLSTNATSWQWSFAGGMPATSTDKNPQNVCYLSSGGFNVTLIASNSGGSDTLSVNNFITVSASPPTPVITQVHNDTLFCSTNSSYISYQWYSDSTLITNATDTFLVISTSGNYNVDVTNSTGCKTAVGINVILGLQNYTSDDLVSLWPNPTGNQFTVYGLRFTVRQLDIYNVLGQVCQQSKIVNRKSEIDVDVSSLPSGMYFIQLIGEEDKTSREPVERWLGRFVKE